MTGGLRWPMHLASRPAPERLPHSARPGLQQGRGSGGCKSPCHNSLPRWNASPPCHLQLVHQSREAPTPRLESQVGLGKPPIRPCGWNGASAHVSTGLSSGSTGRVEHGNANPRERWGGRTFQWGLQASVFIPLPPPPARPAGGERSTPRAQTPQHCPLTPSRGPDLQHQPGRWPNGSTQTPTWGCRGLGRDQRRFGAGLGRATEEVAGASGMFLQQSQD